MKLKYDDFKVGDWIIWKGTSGATATAKITRIVGYRVWCNEWSDETDKKKENFVTLGDSHFRKLTKLDKALA